MRVLSSPAAAWGSTPCACSTSSAAPLPVTRAFNRVARRGRLQAARGAAVLEREDRIEEVHPTSYEFLTDRDWSKEFAEYRRATEQLDELQSLQAELMNSVETMDNFLFAKQPSQQQQQSPEARRAKRQQTRAARKTSTAAASTATASASTAVIELEHASVSASPAAPPQPKSRRAAISATPALDTAPSQPSLLSAPTPTVTPKAATRASTEISTLSLSIPSQPLSQPAPTSSPLSLAFGGALALPTSSASTAREKQQARASRSSTQRVSTTEVIAARFSSNKSSSSSTDGTAQFMKNASSTQLLKPEQQKEVAIVVKDFLTLKSIEKELKAILKRPPTIVEWARAAKMDNPMLFQARLKQGQEAKALMLKSNYRLVIKVVKAYQNRGLSMQDLITEGVQGLLRGVEKFEVDKGFRFSTYAHWWIRQAVTRALQEQGRTVRLPTHIYEQIVRITMAKSNLAKKLGRQPTVDELSEAVGISAEKIPEILAASNQAMSLDSAVAGDEDGGMEIKDTIADDRSQPDETFADDMIKQNLDVLLSTLSPREAGVLRMHWGLDGGPELTLEEIGAHYGITRERVRQLESRALRQLKEQQGLGKAQLGVMSELKDLSFSDDVVVSSRASRGTKKT